MAVHRDGPAPYAPTTAVVGVIEAYRDRSPQTPFTVDVLIRIGVADSLAPRTLQALKLLDLIDDAGNPTDAFVGVKQAPHDEFQSRLADVVRAAYAEVFAYCDPVADSTVRVTDAFRHFNPPSMKDRMVRLFYGLCEYSGIIETAPRIESGGAAAKPRRPRVDGPTAGGQPDRNDAGRAKTSPPAPPPPPAPPRHLDGLSHLHPALAGLLKLVPPADEAWPQERRDRFMRAWEATLDVCNPVESAASDSQE